jgi:hypothetical protein
MRFQETNLFLRHESQVLKPSAAIVFSFWNVLAIGECRIGTHVPKWNKGGDRFLLLSADFRTASVPAKLGRIRAFVMWRCRSSTRVRRAESKPPGGTFHPGSAPPSGLLPRRQPALSRTFVLVWDRALVRGTTLIVEPAFGPGRMTQAPVRSVPSTRYACPTDPSETPPRSPFAEPCDRACPASLRWPPEFCRTLRDL